MRSAIKEIAGENPVDVTSKSGEDALPGAAPNSAPAVTEDDPPATMFGLLLSGDVDRFGARPRSDRYSVAPVHKRIYLAIEKDAEGDRLAAQLRGDISAMSKGQSPDGEGWLGRLNRVFGVPSSDGSATLPRPGLFAGNADCPFLKAPNGRMRPSAYCHLLRICLYHLPTMDEMPGRVFRAAAMLPLVEALALADRRVQRAHLSGNGDGRDAGRWVVEVLRRLKVDLDAYMLYCAENGLADIRELDTMRFKLAN